MNVATGSLALPWFLALLLSGSAMAGDGQGISDGVVLDCRARVGAADRLWSVKLDSTTPVAAINGQQMPAEYSASHARLRLPGDEGWLVVGRKTGRLLVTDLQGKSVGLGVCQLAQTAGLDGVGTV